ncbi:MAG: hypothetical protein ACXVBE_02985, partial [Bdellovibrionota bacterium]
IFAGYAMTLVPPISELEPRELKVLKKLERCKVVVSQEQANFSGKPALFAKLSSCLDRKYTASWKDFMKHPERIDEQDPDAEQPDTLPCYGIYDEHFADAFGSRVFGKILETSANAQEMSRVAMMEFASEVCATAGEPNHGGYPTSKDRLMIEMSPANVQKALGCVLPATKVCGTSDFITYPKVAAKPAEDSPAAEKNAN